MSAERDEPTEMSTWRIERLKARAAEVQGNELEGVRLIAQWHACHSDEPREARLQWAALSLEANRRGQGDGPWERARVLRVDFTLRTWIIENLGPGPESAYDPEVLAADTLVALTHEPAQAVALAADWRSLPIEQIGDLRRHKNLTAHVDRLVVHLRPGPTMDLLLTWIEARKQLP
ncbi:hypothetical protein [Longispora urticae]